MIQKIFGSFISMKIWEIFFKPFKLNYWKHTIEQMRDNKYLLYGRLILLIGI
jgi:hypothetical protein